MGLSILERPIGVGLGSSQTAAIEEDYIGMATVKTVTPHTLIEDQYVYVKSFVENYNGFWKIHFIDGYHFFLKNDDGSYVSFIVSTTATIYPQTFTHGWSCVELPIVYKLLSDRFPVNNVDSGSNISTYSNDNGYVKLTLFVPLGSFSELQFVKITNSDVDGIYQIIDKSSSSVFTINLIYQSTYSLTAAPVSIYYSNYHVNIKITSGLPTDNSWAALKPYQAAATLSFIPDSNNEVRFSISEILKSFITQSNNLLLASLPNNIDAVTQFYISYEESYDISNGYTITTFESGFVDDKANLEGTAANSMLLFKNLQSGYLTDYIMNRATAKFLTLFAIPTLFSGCYQDVSFVINNRTGPTQVPALATWFNGVSRGPATWTLGATPSINIFAPNQQSFIIQSLVTGYKVNVSYTFSYNLTISHSPISSSNVRFYLLDNSETILATSSLSISGTGGLAGTVTLMSTTSIPTRIGISSDNGSSGSIGVVINEFLYTGATGFGFGSYVFRQAYYSNGALLSTTNTNISPVDNGIHRMQLIPNTNADQIAVSVLGDGSPVSEMLTVAIDTKCVNQVINLTWLNNLGGFDYWSFTAFKTYSVNIPNTGETKQNIFPNWPKSYGEVANTINKQTFRESQNQISVNSQYLTLDQLSALQYIKSSILVEIINDRFDKRRVIVDKDSFVSHVDNDKLHTLSFTITYTDDIPAQSV